LKNGQLQSKYLLFEKPYHLITLFRIEGIQPQIRQDNQQQQQQSMYLYYHLIYQIFFIYLDFPQQNQVFGSQQWLSKLFRQSLFRSNDLHIDQVPDIKTQNNQRFGSPSQSWPGKILRFKNPFKFYFCSSGSQTIQNQPQFQGIIFLSSNV